MRPTPMDMKPDAWELFSNIRSNGEAGLTPREAGEMIGMHANRVASLCSRWSDRGWYDYGTCVDLGWLTGLGFFRLKVLDADLSYRRRRKADEEFERRARGEAVTMEYPA